MPHHHHKGQHDHDHDHDQNDDHSHPPSTELSFEDKMVKLLAHWIQHNDDHANNYRDWANRATEKGLAPIAEMLEEAARLTDRITETLTAADPLLRPTSGRQSKSG